MAPFILPLLGILGKVGEKVASNLFPDPADQLKKEAAQQQFVVGIMEQAQAIESAAAAVIKAEASSGHWLAANWRPITMLVFVGLVCARWLGYTAPGMTEAEYLSIYDLIKIGLGGYVVGRSAEKIVPQVAAMLAQRKD